MPIVKIGEMNKLNVARVHDLGAFLDGGELGEVLLPRRFMPEACERGSQLDIFVYKDIDGQLVATTKKPLAQVGEVAYLKVAAVNKVGAFLSWGLPKDLLCPFSEQKSPMEAGRQYPVMVFLDDQYRIAASARLDDFLEDENQGQFENGQEVQLLVASKTPLGYKAVINNSHWGVLYQSELFKPVRIGQSIQGYIRRIRDDGRIDLTLQKPGHTRTRVEQLAETILKQVQSQQGFLGMNDKTPPDKVYESFGVSKKVFKQALGHLLRQDKISIGDDGIHLKS